MNNIDKAINALWHSNGTASATTASADLVSKTKEEILDEMVKVFNSIPPMPRFDSAYLPDFLIGNIALPDLSEFECSLFGRIKVHRTDLLKPRMEPIRKHKKRRNQSLAYHRRIQKKWTKRFGEHEVHPVFLVNQRPLFEMSFA